jgi:hypothetical protein
MKGINRFDCDPPHFSYLSQINQGSFTPSSEAMVEKTLLEFSATNINNIRIGPAIGHEDLFSGKVHEDASAHLQNYLEKGTTISIKDIPKETILRRLFPFSLKRRARQWFYSNEINTWEECSTTFLSKFFPTGKTNELCGKITNFQQQKGESIPEASERLQEYISDCPRHGIIEWMLLQSFYHG